MISYLQLIRMIKTQPNGLLFYKMSDDTEDKLSRLEDAGCIRSEWSFDDNMNAGKRYTVAPKPTEPPKPTVKEIITVSHWKQGARAGKKASGTFEVVKRFELNGTPFVSYQFTDDLVHTVKAEYTKAVA